MKRLADRQSLFNQSLEIYEYQVSTNNSNKQKEDFDDEEKRKITSPRINLANFQGKWR